MPHTSFIRADSSSVCVCVLVYGCHNSACVCVLVCGYYDIVCVSMFVVHSIEYILRTQCDLHTHTHSSLTH